LDGAVGAAELLAVERTPGRVTAAGVRGNVAVALRYFDAWLGGTGAAAINHLMEDAATAEIARCQLWQWIHHGTPMADGGRVTAELVRALLSEEVTALATGRSAGELARLCSAAAVFEANTLEEDLPAFFTTGAYAQHLTSIER
jgi:malate synthase